MRCARLWTAVRYRHLCKRSFFAYLCALLFLVLWTSSEYSPLRLFLAKGRLQPPAQHVHRGVSDIDLQRDSREQQKKARTPTPRLLNAPRYNGTYLLANHSHPVLPLPPLADFSVQKPAFGRPCRFVRMVEFYGRKLTLDQDPVCQWLENPEVMADQRLYVYAQQMALLYDVTVHADRREAGPKGGEQMEEVWGQAEGAEYLKLQPGYFSLPCSTIPHPRFGPKDHLSQWSAVLQCTTFPQPAPKSTVPGLTLAIQRYEYVNLYHTMTDFYNAFLTALVFNQHPDRVTLLWVDAHPQGGLDDTWKTLFGPVLLAGRLPHPTLFPAMAWVPMGYNSPLNEHSRPSVPYLEEFRHFFLSRHGVDSARVPNCAALRFLFIWRRNYAAHPRNKGGRIQRKIDNEEEVLAAVQSTLGPGDSVKGLQLDALPMKQQLELIAATDVLLGMHGAGLSHTLFLPLGGALLEFYPTYWPQANAHFRSMARWRGLHYQSWQNEDHTLEKADHRTYIPPTLVIRMVKEARQKMCG